MIVLVYWDKNCIIFFFLIIYHKVLIHLCLMLVSRVILTYYGLMYRCSTERKRQRLDVEYMEGQMGRVFLEYGTPLTLVSLFQYLGLTLLSSNNNWPVVERNLRRARGKWLRLANILGRERADMRTVGSFMFWWYMWCFCLCRRRGF